AGSAYDHDGQVSSLSCHASPMTSSRGGVGGEGSQTSSGTRIAAPTSAASIMRRTTLGTFGMTAPFNFGTLILAVLAERGNRN
ncbi:MAG: hypothetical protein V3S51_01335, partial [Dehalococcoidia bacterium]